MVKFLGVIATLLFIAIVGVTIFSFVTGRARPGKSLRPLETPQGISAPKALTNSEANSPGSFTGIKQIRAITKPALDGKSDIGTPVVITPWFTYPKDDTAFREELAQKSGMMTSVIVNYFAAHTEEELMKNGERKVKNDLLEQINSQLVLGKIDEIYFTDYIFLK